MLTCLRVDVGDRVTTEGEMGGRRMGEGGVPKDSRQTGVPGRTGVKALWWQTKGLASQEKKLKN